MVCRCISIFEENIDGYFLFEEIDIVYVSISCVWVSVSVVKGTFIKYIYIYYTYTYSSPHSQTWVEWNHSPWRSAAWRISDGEQHTAQPRPLRMPHQGQRDKGTRHCTLHQYCTHIPYVFSPLSFFLFLIYIYITLQCYIVSSRSVQLWDKRWWGDTLGSTSVAEQDSQISQFGQ